MNAPDRVVDACRALLVAVVAIVIALILPTTAGAASDEPIRVGVGRADITPPTGYFTFGYVRSDSVGNGAHGRLWARAIVIEQGDEKIALVAEDLGSIPGGMLEEAIDQIGRPGFSQENVLVSASHTHLGPTGMMNFDTYNTVFMTLNSPADFQLTGGFSQPLYTFLVDRLALAIRRADRDLAPGRLGWGHAQIFGLTENRSIEPHLRDHRIAGLDYGEGSPGLDPQGVTHTVDHDVNVLRVEKRREGRWMPVGMWSNYANHGTVVHFQFTYWSADHHGPATLVSERRVRIAGRVPPAQEVVTVFANGNEGDMSSALTRAGPAAADYVGRVEASAFMRAWQSAGKRLIRRPEINLRWTRMCFCGQQTSAGPVSDEPALGMAEFTGSDEARGPLFDITGIPFEGITGPDTGGPQGNKLAAPLPVDVPSAVPLTTLQIGDRLLASVPGEMTVEMGRRVRSSIEAAADGLGIKRSMIVGLANEYTSYYTTPEEYSAQHYEGAATLYGKFSSYALLDVLTELTAAMSSGKPAPKPYAFDPTNGLSAGGESFPQGASSALALAQPAPSAERLGDPRFEWRGGPRGFDKPLDRAFVLVQRSVPGSTGKWRTIDQDLGLRILWGVDDDGRYFTRWEPALNTPPGRYRFKVRANRYELTSDTFELGPSSALVPQAVKAPAGRVAVVLGYPGAVAEEEVGDPPGDPNADLTFRPQHSMGGVVRFLVDGRPVRVPAGPGGRFEVAAPSSASVRIPIGSAQDQHGNFNGEPVVLVP